MEGENSSTETNTDNPKVIQSKNCSPDLGPSTSRVFKNQRKNGVGSVTKSVKKEKPIPNWRERNSEQTKPTNNVTKGAEEVKKPAVGYHQKKVSQEKSQMMKTNSKSSKNKKENETFLDDLNEESFEIDDIIRSPDSLSLIEDLVNCFTDNLKLPETELLNLKLSLFERTSSVILKLLNNCVEKTFNRVLQSDVMTELKNENLVSKQDASCQTNFPSPSEGEVC